ncbi:MAG: methionine--tRNA ligase, partial [Candidatus Nitrotoga sp.]
MSRKILVTSALPYANGSIHLGHLVEYIQTDIWVRFQKMQGHTCHYVCADDTHGTPVMLRAEKEGITPEELIARVWQEHYDDFKAFHVEFDHYGSTNSKATQAFSNTIYGKLKAAGLIAQRSIEQFYDPLKQMFLPDRFIKGECPKCGAKDQYGDNCEVCGAAYTPAEVKNPYSAVSGAKPEMRESVHYFFKLSDPRCQKFLQDWTTGKLTQEPPLQAEAANKMQEWLGEAGDNKLTDWDISRDAPYFGFEIPDAPGKYFYVWLDAPVGYMGSFMALCKKENINFDDYWKLDSSTELYHFIGKDILYFHALFWPAMLQHAGYRTPTKLFAHGFLTVNGEKMSKSRGTFITAKSYIDAGLNPEYLRYYYAAKLNGSMEDIDLNLEDFVAKVNSDLIGKYVNIASRAEGFIHRLYGGEIARQDTFLDSSTWTASSILHEAREGNTNSLPHLLGLLREDAKEIALSYELRDYGKALRRIMERADLVNKVYDAFKPWEAAKTNKNLAGEICVASLEAFRLLTIYLSPVLPKLAGNAFEFLNLPKQNWPDVNSQLRLGHKINEYKHLMTRLDPKQIEAMVVANQESLNPPSPAGRGIKGEGTHKIPLPESVKTFARKLRHEQTDTEALMWELLRDRRMGGVKFRRQHAVGAYVLDFFCHEANLAIELDGGQHAEAQAHDEKRTVFLNSKGIEV